MNKIVCIEKSIGIISYCRLLFIVILFLLNCNVGFSQEIISIDSNLNYPQGITLDANQNVYVANSMANQIVMISSSGVQSIVAGNNVPFYCGDNGAATAACLYNPYDVTLDKNGNIYIADLSNNRIREVNAVTGIITTIAGDSSSGYNGDGILAINAKLDNPKSVAVDDSGNVYIADAVNNRIREVEFSSGKIYTVAGNGTGGFNGDGNASTTELNGPASLAIDKKHNIYIADESNNRIRKLDISSNNLITVAGDTGSGVSIGDGGQATAAHLYYPTGIALDTAGNLYIADNYNNRIRKVNITTGIINTVAGNGKAGFSGDGGMATNAELYYPVSIAVDDSENIYISDENNNRIRKVCQKLTGVLNVFQDHSLEVYPNPSSNGDFTFKVNGVHEVVNIQVYSIMDQKIFEDAFNPDEGMYKLNLSDKNDGIYLYRIYCSTKTIRGGKLLINK